MTIRSKRRKAYGIENPLVNLTPLPIIAKRDPTTADVSSDKAVTWVNELTNNIWILTSIANGIANWEPVSQSAGGNAPLSKYVIDADGTGDFTTIQAGIDAANADGGNETVYVRPGTYTENLNLVSNINIFGTDRELTIIAGTHTPPAAGNILFDGVRLTDSSAILSSAAAGTTRIGFKNCYFTITNGWAVNLPNWTGIIFFLDSVDLGSGENGIVDNNGGTSVVSIEGCSIGRGGIRPVFFAGTLEIKDSIIPGSIQPSGAGRLLAENSQFNNAVITSGTGASSVLNSFFSTAGLTSVINNSTGAFTLDRCSINTAAVVAIGGTGDFNLGGITWLNSRGLEATATYAYLPTISKITDFVVGPSGNFGTIQEAVDFANDSGGGIVYVQFDTYTEDLTLYDNISIVGFQSLDGSRPTITGQHLPPESGAIAFKNLYMTDPDDVLFSAAAGTTTVSFENCVFNVTSGYAANLQNWTGKINFRNCDSRSATDGGVFNTGGSDVDIYNSVLGAPGIVAFNVTGVTRVIGSKIDCPTIFDTGSALFADNSIFTDVLTADGSSTGEICNSRLSATGIGALDMLSSANWSVSASVIDSNNNPAVTGNGAGVLTIANVSFLGNTLLAGTLTLSVASRTKVEGLDVVEGTNGRSGQATLAGGTIVVGNTSVTANTRIHVTPSSVLAGTLYISARTPGTSFTITSTNGADTPTADWLLVEPA